jgi:hypothetical protein
MRCNKAGQSIDVIETRPCPKVGRYRSENPLTAEEIDAELARGFGDHDRR